MKNLANQFWVNRDLKTTMERLSSGLRINRGADDPAGLAISESMRAHYRGIDQALENTQEAISYLRARDSAMAEQQDVLMRVMELAVRAANEATLTSSDLQKMNSEAQALADELDNLGNNSSLRGSESRKLLFDAGQLDVIWVVDQTVTMGSSIASIITAAPDMFALLAAKGFDLRMGVVGFRNGAGPFGPSSPPGSPFNAITADGSRTLQSSSGSFVADVSSLIIGGGVERGLDACMEAIYATPMQAQMNARPNAQRVMILLSDADSDDNGDVGANNGINTTAVQRQFVVDTLDSWNMAFFVANNIREGAPNLPADADYTDIASRVAAGGGSMDLDVPGVPGATPNWVNTISNALQAFGGPYSMSFQVGPDNVSEDRIELNFKTVTARTTGLSVTLTDSTSAANSITNVQSAMDFISQERAITGAYMNRIEAIINDLTAERINTTAAKSNIADTDIAETATAMTKQQIILSSATAAGVHANATPSAVLNLISEQGVGQDNALLV